MYQYTDIDQRIVDERVAQFRDQTERHLRGELSEDEFRPLRLQNGLYIQKHAPMLRVAIPYGLLNSEQVRMFAHIAREYDRDYAHFTTRQNIQYNWPELARVPDILRDLASVQMHAIQTSGNCIRNTTTDQFAGIAPDEVVNPLVWAEIIRQWSTIHPEFAYLPRKFKIAISGSTKDRAATLVHDIGLIALTNDAGDVGFRVIVGGGLGRTPIVGVVIKEFLPWQHLITYLEAILRVYNRLGRRDNKYKARIKITVKENTPAQFSAWVEEEFSATKNGPTLLTADHVAAIANRFTQALHLDLPTDDAAEVMQAAANNDYARWRKRNTHAHNAQGYAAITLSLKRKGVPPGDITADELDAVALLADQYSQGELRVTHEQNLVFADVEVRALPALWSELKALGFATPNIGLIGNMIACPGGDFCSLANAASLPVAAAITERFESLDYQFNIGELDLNISGCINACGHHHVGHIGILGVDKNGEEWYQVTLGGTQGNDAKIGKIIGPSFARAEVTDVVEQLIETYLTLRERDDERFVDVVARTGIEPFKERVYAQAN
ncbi:MAG: nitrite/sulfite reductase [Betaproteobacteria bacterium]|nr:MAG: nitrite/sulfite reductase [Betaproteobacteria bacterium]